MLKENIDETKYFERNLAVFGQTSLNNIRNLNIIIVNLNSVSVKV